MSYHDKSSEEMITPQPAPLQGIDGSDAWLDGILFAEGAFSMVGDPHELHVSAQVLRDMRQRRQMGIDKYGTPLQYATNRDNVIDQYQEDLDGYVYGTAAINAPNDLTDAQRDTIKDIRRLRLRILMLTRAL